MAVAHGAVAAESSANILPENGGAIRAATDSRLPAGRSCSQSSRLGFSEPAPSAAHEQLRESYTVVVTTGIQIPTRSAPAGARDRNFPRGRGIMGNIHRTLPGRVSRWDS